MDLLFVNQCHNHSATLLRDKYKILSYRTEISFGITIKNRSLLFKTYPRLLTPFSHCKARGKKLTYEHCKSFAATGELTVSNGLQWKGILIKRQNTY